ncbi:MAG: lytic transglycosylase domain-containing protein [Chloroflexota bacterium]|nr:MAG: lytic transglycosylase domain-containing protein [Chloroflexota bacterium]
MGVGKVVGCGVIAAVLLPLSVALFLVVGLLAFIQSFPSPELVAAATDHLVGGESWAVHGGDQRGGNSFGSLASYASEVAAASERFGVDPRLVMAVMRQESGGNPYATSAVGAAGLMQLMPATFASMGYDPSRIYEPSLNIEAGTRYLSSTLAAFGGDVYWAVAAYNAGGGQARWLKDTYGYVPASFAGGETFRFVHSVLTFLEGA